jgi:hypothetical protein
MYTAIQKASEIADKQLDFFRFVVYLMEDKLEDKMTKEEKIVYVEKRIAGKRGNIKSLQRMLTNLQKYGEVQEPGPKWPSNWRRHEIRH